MPDHWYNNYKQIVAFAKTLYRANVIKTQDEIFGYFDRPSDYDSAYELWVELGSPEPRDKEWREFVDGIEVEVEDESAESTE